METPPLAALALSALLVGCASSPAAPQRQPPPQAMAGPSVRALDLPGAPGAGPPREVRAVAEVTGLKVVTIVLRGGAVLPEHHAKAQVTIVALSGAGVLVAGGERHRLDAKHAVLLAAGVPHSVEPDAGSDLVLLVHHAGGGDEHHHHESPRHPGL